MWYLTSENDKRVLYVLPEKNITIGRSLDAQNCNFAVPEDPSISRKHASLLVSDDCLQVKDLGSKYGTFINGSAVIEHNALTKLNCNDIVKFGKMGCVWKVGKINFITCTSTLKGENLHSLKNIIGQIGGIIRNDWDETCDYLTMPAITLTIKVVLALVQNSHIVTVDYWNKCLEAIKNNSSLPSPEHFIPQILESTLNKESVSFLPYKARSSLFTGKKVIFFSRRQHEMYKPVLLKSSATPLLLSDTKMNKSTLCNDDVIVIQYNVSSISQETQNQRDQINDIVNYLKSKNKRVVADAEIGLAVLYCSTSKYCNPGFNFSSEVIKQVPSQSSNSRNVLALESQEQSEVVCKKENVLIDESLSAKHDQSSVMNFDVSNTSKRKWSDEGEMNPIKKIALEANKNINESNTNKRPAEQMDDFENQSKRVALGGDSDEDDDIFNFVKTSTTTTKSNESNTVKKLNLSKPLKRKLSTVNDEEDLFNFVDKGNKKPAIDKPNDQLEQFDANSATVANRATEKRVATEEKIDVAALRGSKLDELMKNISNVPYNRNIKKEETADLEEKFNNIDLGSTTLIVRKDLIIKREPLEITSSESGLKNFKKFKKVWPVKLQITVVSKSSLNAIDAETNENINTINV